MADILSPELAALIDKRALVGISYFDINGDALQQRMLAGTVVRVTAKDGITLRQNDDEEFTLPSSMASWFHAPVGNYKTDSNEAISNPDYLSYLGCAPLPRYGQTRRRTSVVGMGGEYDATVGGMMLLGRKSEVGSRKSEVGSRK